MKLISFHKIRVLPFCLFNYYTEVLTNWTPIARTEANELQYVTNTTITGIVSKCQYTKMYQLVTVFFIYILFELFHYLLHTCLIR